MSWAAAAGAGGNIVSTILTNKANAKAADNQMSFQKFMSNTSHQREVVDLRKAGLNPILSANAGASTPGGATYTAQAPQIDPMLFHNTKQSSATTKNIVADTGLKAANTSSALKSIEIADEQKKLLQAQSVKEGELARQAHTTANLQDKYGEASQVMGLINSGTGSIGNLMSVPNLLKNLFTPNKSSPQIPKSYNNYYNKD